MAFRIFVINPGSTSTKISIYENSECTLETNIEHDRSDVEKYEPISDQYEFRKKALLDEVIAKNNIDMKSFDMYAARGPALFPVTGGTYCINEAMLDDILAHVVKPEHASILAAMLANAYRQENGVPCCVTDPPTLDEMSEIAKITGVPGIRRLSRFHALNQKAVGRYAAKEVGKDYSKGNFIVCHMGGGSVSIGMHRNGIVEDVNNGADCDWPFALDRCGSLTAVDVIKLSYSGKYTMNELREYLAHFTGFKAHLGTTDVREVVKMIEAGDSKAKLIYDAFIYQIAKQIGAFAACLCGEVDAIALTGGIAYEQYLVARLTEMVGFIAPVKVYPGGFEMQALAEGDCRVLAGEEDLKEYVAGRDA